jgi:hypothetical protein
MGTTARDLQRCEHVPKPPSGEDARRMQARRPHYAVAAVAAKTM